MVVITVPLVVSFVAPRMAPARAPSSLALTGTVICNCLLHGVHIMFGGMSNRDATALNAGDLIRNDARSDAFAAPVYSRGLR
jgi:hypothetical protein